MKWQRSWKRHSDPCPAWGPRAFRWRSCRPPHESEGPAFGMQRKEDLFGEDAARILRTEIVPVMAADEPTGSRRQHEHGHDERGELAPRKGLLFRNSGSIDHV